MTAAPPRVLGFWAAVSIVMGNMIGSGVFLLPASLAAYRGLSLAGWAVSAGGAVLLALVFARLARQLPATGGLYAYTRAAFGDFAGFFVAWGYWLSIVGTLAALAVACVGYLDPFIPSIVRAPGAAAALAIATVWLVIGVNIAGVGLAGRVQIVTTVLKLLPLAVVGVGGVLYFQPDAFLLPDTTTTPMGTQLLTVVTLTLWAFLGLECATIPAGSVRNPARTIPLATVAGTVVTAAIYIVSTVGVMSLVAPDVLATSTAPFADAAGQLLGGVGGQLVAAGAAISCFGALNGWALMAGQLPMAAAADGLFPPVFGHLTARGTPARGMIVGGVLATVLVAMNYSQGLVALFTFIILLCTLSTLVPYVFCSLAVWLMPGESRPRGTAALVSVLAFVYAMFAIGGAGADTVFYGFLLLLAGLPVYVWLRRAAGPPA
ncbi:MAG TPA: amino acid permease [Vicinamibacterales bacterium]|nr:amino acid permease [Vicinamibacterales bacterium]